MECREDDIMQKNLGEFLKNLRVRNGYTQKELANILIVTPQTVSKWELNNSTPSLEVLLDLSNLYGITTDEIIKTELKKRVKEEKYFSLKNVTIYIIYLLMIGIGISINFVDYFTVNIDYLKYGLLDIFPEETESIVEVTTIIDNYLLLVSVIFIPLFLLVLKLIDKKKSIYLFISTFFGLVNLVFILPYLYSPYFIRPEIGIVLHMIFTLLVFLSSLIVMSEKDINLYKLLEEKPLELAGSLLMFIIAILLPGGFLEDGYQWEAFYFSFSEYFLLFAMFITPLVLVLKTHKGLKSIINIYVLALVLVLLFISLVYMFNSGLLYAGILIYSYVICIGIVYQPTISNANLTLNKKILPRSFYFIEGISFITYLYLFVDGGDLFGRQGYSVRINNMVNGNYIYFLFLLLLISMMIRYAGLKKVARISYAIFTGLIIFVTYSISVEYYLNPDFYTTDGLLFLVTPVLLGAFYIIYLVRSVFLAINNRDISYLNPFKEV